ncbi:MAG: hypothetical protein AB1640_17255 [bacterium]
MERTERTLGRRDPAGRRRGMLWVLYLPGACLVLLGMVVLLFPEAIRFALGGFFVGAGFLLAHLARVGRRILSGLQAQVEIYSQESDDDPPDVTPSDSMRDWIN